MSTAPARLLLYTDGGGERDSSAASAFILESPEEGKQIKICSALGGATNNEAEIFAALLGFAFIRASFKTPQAISEIQWVSDSEYVLKSATEYMHTWLRNGWRTAQKKPVKNQGLWRCYLELSSGLKIRPQHVAGHSGHPENEACDRACTWLRNAPPYALVDLEDGFPMNIGHTSLDSDWYYVDGRLFLMRLREEIPPEAELAALETHFREGKLPHRFLSSEPGLKSDSGEGQRNAPTLEPLLAKLRIIQKKANTLGSEDPTAKDLADSIRAILKRFN